MDFFGKFCSLLKQRKGNENDCDDHPLLADIFSHLLQVSFYLYANIADINLYMWFQASWLINDTIRLRSCQLINKIFDNLVGVDLSQDLCDNIENNLLVRLQVSYCYFYCYENHVKNVNQKYRNSRITGFQRKNGIA